MKPEAVHHPDIVPGLSYRETGREIENKTDHDIKILLEHTCNEKHLSMCNDRDIE